MSDTGLTDNDKAGHYVEIWKQTVQVQQHFNDLEWRIRGLALTAATFALGASAVAAKDGTTFNGISLGSGVLVVGLVLWYAFYFVDKYWYHPLLKSAVAHGSQIEEVLRTWLPAVGLTDTISAGSPQTPKLFGKFELRKKPIHSGHKMNRFYFTGALALVIAAAALQLAASFSSTSSDQDKPTVVRIDHHR